MGKFRSVFQMDDPFIEDGDISFKGIDQITEPTRLEPSVVTEAENVRISEGTAISRGGLKLMFKFSHLPNGTDRVTQLVTYSPPLGVERLLLLGGISNQYYLSDSYSSDIDNSGVPTVDNIAFPAEVEWRFFRNISTSPNVPYFNYAFRVIQAYDQLIIFPAYSSGSRPFVWDDTMTEAQALSGVHGMWLQDENGDYVDLNGDPTLVRVQDPSFMVCPQASFGIYFQNRLIVPWFDDSPTSVAISDSLNNNLFKKTNTFFLNKGQGDVILSLCPYLEDQVLVLCRKSIHIISNISTLESGGRATEITRQLGIAGTNAWTQNGSYIYFISNEGDIQVMVPQLDPSKGLGIAISKVNLDSEPLSKKIPNILKRVNVNAIDTSILHYHKNLVYCALPLDGATRPTHIVVYDSLRAEFISLDTFSNNLSSNQNPIFTICDIHTFQDEVYIATDSEVYKYSELQRDESEDIEFKLTTRSYIAQDYGTKKFVSGKINFDLGGEQVKTQGIFYGNRLAPDLVVGSKIRIISNNISSADGLSFHPSQSKPILIQYPIADEWLVTGEEYLLSNVSRRSDGGISDFEIRKPNSTTDYVIIDTWTRDVDYEVLVDTELEITAITNAPNSTTKVKEISTSTDLVGNFQSYNVRQRGQSMKLEIKSNGKTAIRSVSVDAVVQNSRNIGDYS